MRPQKTVAFFILVASMLMLARAAQTQTAADDEHVLGVIHTRLMEPNRITYNHPIIFVARIARLGPVFQGVCKTGVGEDVDFSVAHLLMGDFGGTTVHASYINCTQGPLPSPPFTLSARVIAYCEEPHQTQLCLNPVPYTLEREQLIQSWIDATKPPSNKANKLPGAMSGASH